MNTAELARWITRNGSKQTYFVARMLVDRNLEDDFLRAYAYFRWVDDVIDVHARSTEERITFIKRQKAIIDGLYENQTFDDLTLEEQIVADLVLRDPRIDDGLESFIRNMLAIIAFDAHRHGRLITQNELAWYSETLGRSVTDGIQHFVGNGHPYPQNKARFLAASAAHITHLLRDMLKDIADGFINIPKEYLEAHKISPHDFDAQAYRTWVKERVILARRFFLEGKKYLDLLGVLRCKIVGYWYCARFEGVLDTIERDKFVLREVYNERRSIATHLKIGWIGVVVTLRHVVRKLANILNLQTG